MIRIVVDVHELGSEVFSILEHDPQIELEVKGLSEGDYLIANRVLLERKTSIDFVACMRTGRLFQQAYRLKSRRDLLPLFVVEDTSTVGLITAPGLGAQLTLALSYGIPLIVVHGPMQLAWLIKRIGEQVYRRKAKAHISLLGRTRNPGSEAESVLQRFQGIGSTKARALLRRFGSLMQVFAATEKELASVHGIGPKLAKQMRRVLDTPGTDHR